MNLDELEAKARAAKEADETFRAADPPLGRNVTASRQARAALHSLLDPDTILHLVERARAAEELSTALSWMFQLLARYDELLAELGEDPTQVHTERNRTGLKTARAALAHWESLAHLPQEAK